MKKPFNFETREQNLKNFKNQEYDLLIIGGGITGAGVARDAASRGMKVALVEKNDFASGTSSRSSKLVHGGIRYLENLEFGLVYEALSERALLFDMAPHLVHPLRFLLPMYKDSRVGMFKMGLGMWLYDILSLFEAPEMHERLSGRESVDRIPSLNNENLMGSFVYSDAYMDDDRLVIETLRSANDLGAECVNFTKAVAAEFDQGKMTALNCKDGLTGENFQIKAKHFVSTVGPWTDEVGHQLLGEWSKIMRPSKGIHLTLSRERLPLSSAVVMATGKRIVFAIPRHEMVIVGTTDTDFKEDPAEVKSTEEDVDYLLKVVDEYFPGAKLTKEDLIASYAGVRPLVHDGSQTESSTSREHLIWNDDRNITFVAGGKYTTYRNMAEQTVESTLSYFDIDEQVKFAHGDTRKALNERVTVERFQRAQQSFDKYKKVTEISERELSILIDRHGEEVEDLLSYKTTQVSCPWQKEAQHAINHTMCLNLEDFYLRRSPLFLSMKDHGISLLDNISEVFVENYSWSESEKNQQIEKVKAHIANELSWKN